jgi:L-2-hydroxyglutarate oxidase LhgO
MDSEITIIGAGVIGLAIAERISRGKKNVFIIEKHLTFGQETSSRNSEVIHAGIYYPEGSLKARFCVEGKQMLYDFCEKYNVAFRNCGKLIVATNESEIPILREIKIKAGINSVNDLIEMNEDEIRELEPEISAVKALFSPSTGIIDTHSLMKQFETNAVNGGVQFVYGSEVTAIRKLGKGYEITLNEADGSIYTFTTKTVINSGGLTADKISEMVGIKDDSLRIRFCKGDYFRLSTPKNKLIGRLIYPVPYQNLEGIGIHVTIDMGGGVKLGPDVTWLDSNIYDFRVDLSKHETFYLSAKKFLPFIEKEDIVPEMAGIRPKIQVPGGPVCDFYIREESQRGFPDFINLIGMESPGLTSSLAIAEYVYSLIAR